MPPYGLVNLYSVICFNTYLLCYSKQPQQWSSSNKERSIVSSLPARNSVSVDVNIKFDENLSCYCPRASMVYAVGNMNISTLLHHGSYIELDTQQSSTLQNQEYRFEPSTLIVSTDSNHFWHTLHWTSEDQVERQNEAQTRQCHTESGGYIFSGVLPDDQTIKCL